MEHLALKNSEEITFQTLQEFCMFCFMKSESLQIIQNIPRTDLFWKLTEMKIKPYWPQKLCQICMRTFNSISKFVNQIKGNIIKFEQLCEQKIHAQTVVQPERVQDEVEIKEQIFPIENVYLVDSNSEEECLMEIDSQNDELKSEIHVEESQIQEIGTNRAKSEIAEETLPISEETQILNTKEISTDYTAINESTHTDDFFTDNSNSENEAENIFDKKIYKCTICHKEIESRFKLQYHRFKYHKKPEQFQCYICNKVFKRKLWMRRHILGTHLQIKKFKCEICGKGFASSRYLSEHKNSHTGQKPYICTYCGRGFTRYSNLYLHDRYHKLKNGEVQQDETTKYYLRLKCDQCETIFKCPSALKQHKKKCGINEKFLCSVCGQELNSEIRLKNHIMRFHSEKNIEENTLENNEKYLCSVCGQEYRSEKGLKNHIMRLHSEKKIEENTSEQRRNTKENTEQRNCDGIPLTCCGKIFKKYERKHRTKKL